MPRGRPRKIVTEQRVNLNDGNPERKEKVNEEKEERKQETEVLTVEPKQAFEPASLREKPEATAVDRVTESRKSLDQPLSPGQKYFESPEGFIVIGDAEKDHAWCRQSNNGKGAWINPRR